MTAICNGVDLSKYVGQGYTYELEPQYGGSITALDGTDHTAKLRDRVKLTVPFIPLPMDKLREILQLFPSSGAYVEWTYYDLLSGSTRIIQAKYDTRTSVLQCAYKNGVEYYSGLVVKLTER